MAAMDVTDERMWLGLIEETRLALATLRVDELEALAGRAEAASEEMRSRSNRASKPSRKVANGHRLLGDLLHETAGNIAVLRRLQNSGENARWER